MGYIIIDVKTSKYGGLLLRPIHEKDRPKEMKVTTAPMIRQRGKRRCNRRGGRQRSRERKRTVTEGVSFGAEWSVDRSRELTCDFPVTRAIRVLGAEHDAPGTQVSTPLTMACEHERRSQLECEGSRRRASIPSSSPSCTGKRKWTTIWRR